MAFHIIFLQSSSTRMFSSTLQIWVTNKSNIILYEKLKLIKFFQYIFNIK